MGTRAQRTAADQRGRPRSQKAHVAVLAATADLMVAGGFESLTVEGIAAAAGVGKQTVYRWWGSKADVVVEAIAEGYLTMPIVTLQDTGDLRGDLATWLNCIKAAVEEEGAARLVEAIMSALASAGETSEAIQQSLIRPIMDGIDARFHAHDRAHPGTLPGPPSFLAETVGANLLLHVLFGWPMSPERVEQLLDLVLPATP